MWVWVMQTRSSGEKRFEAGARTALLIRRSDLPVPLEHPALSYLGGLPKLPPDFDWPRAKVTRAGKEETVALTFLAQVYLSELPRFEGRSALPEQGTLFFFCYSAFDEVIPPPCRVLYHRENAAALPQRDPPSDLMPLGGKDNGYYGKWLSMGGGLHANVEFKYPVSFLTFKDQLFNEDRVRGKLLVKSLCEALGPGEPESTRQLMDVNALAKDVDWPFSWSLLADAARSVVSHVEFDLRPNPRRQMSEATRDVLRDLLTTATEWRERAAAHSPFAIPDLAVRESFRSWWMGAVSRYKGFKRGEVSTYDTRFARDLENAILHSIKLLAAENGSALARAPSKYVDNFRRRNVWTVPRAEEGQFRQFRMAIHQMLGFGKSVQQAPIEHRDHVLLLQLQGDDAFFPWHNNCGCVLQLWIGKDALTRRDFSVVEATLECD